MNRTVHEIKQEMDLLPINSSEYLAVREELIRVRGLTLNEQLYGCKPEEMGTSGLVDYVRGPHWPLVPESTCFHARMECAVEIIRKRLGDFAASRFRVAVYGNRV